MVFVFSSSWVGLLSAMCFSHQNVQIHSKWYGNVYDTNPGSSICANDRLCLLDDDVDGVGCSDWFVVFDCTDGFESAEDIECVDSGFVCDFCSDFTETMDESVSGLSADVWATFGFNRIRDNFSSTLLWLICFGTVFSSFEVESLSLGDEFVVACDGLHDFGLELTEFT